MKFYPSDGVILLVAGNGFVDIANVLVPCTSAEIRRHLDTYIIEFYYDKLKECVVARGGSLNFTLEQARKGYKLAVVNQARTCALMVPFYAKAGHSLCLYAHFVTQIHFSSGSPLMTIRKS